MSATVGSNANTFLWPIARARHFATILLSLVYPPGIRSVSGRRTEIIASIFSNILRRATTQVLFLSFFLSFLFFFFSRQRRWRWLAIAAFVEEEEKEKKKRNNGFNVGSVSSTAASNKTRPICQSVPRMKSRHQDKDKNFVYSLRNIVSA